MYGYFLNKLVNEWLLTLSKIFGTKTRVGYMPVIFQLVFRKICF